MGELSASPSTLESSCTTTAWRFRDFLRGSNRGRLRRARCGGAAVFWANAVHWFDASRFEVFSRASDSERIEGSPSGTTSSSRWTQGDPRLIPVNLRTPDMMRALPWTTERFYKPQERSYVEAKGSRLLVYSQRQTQRWATSSTPTCAGRPATRPGSSMGPLSVVRRAQRVSASITPEYSRVASLGSLFFFHW